MDDPVTPRQVAELSFGHSFALLLLVEELARSGSIDRARYVEALKASYNNLAGIDDAGPDVLANLARLLEHGPKKP